MQKPKDLEPGRLEACLKLVSERNCLPPDPSNSNPQAQGWDNWPNWNNWPDWNNWPNHG